MHGREPLDVGGEPVHAKGPWERTLLCGALEHGELDAIKPRLSTLGHVTVSVGPNGIPRCSR